MALAYCESCGAHIPADQPQFAVEGGVRCQACAGQPEPQQAQVGDGFVQFPCCYCRSLLRLKPVAKRTRIRCPRCDDHFYLHEDGRVEAKLEGSTTAVIATPIAPPLTPSAGTRPGTPPLGVLPQDPPPDKTQPLKRPDAPGDQNALLEGLKPKRMDFLERVPDRPKEEAVVDMSKYATPVIPVREPPPSDAEDSGPLELLPQDVGPGSVAPAPRAPKLAAEEEGRVDLDTEGLKRKTKKYVKGSGGEPEKAPTKSTGRRPQAEPAAKRATEKRKPVEDPAGREERDRRSAEAAARTKELERAQARGALATILLILVVAAPAGLSLLLVSMTSRGAGFATRGVFGEKLRDLGSAADRGVRSLGATVNPVLPPGTVRLPEPERR